MKRCTVVLLAICFLAFSFEHAFAQGFTIQGSSGLPFTDLEDTLPEHSLKMGLLGMGTVHRGTADARDGENYTGAFSVLYGIVDQWEIGGMVNYDFWKNIDTGQDESGFGSFTFFTKYHGLSQFDEENSFPVNVSCAIFSSVFLGNQDKSIGDFWTYNPNSDFTVGGKIILSRYFGYFSVIANVGYVFVHEEDDKAISKELKDGYEGEGIGSLAVTCRLTENIMLFGESFGSTNRWQGDSHEQLEAGGGVVWQINDRFGLSFASYGGLTKSSPDFRCLVGLVTNFDFSDPEPLVVIQEPKPAKPKPPEDSDFDGIIDDWDDCPDTCRGVEVDEVGCPLDSDHDGINDCFDQCPGTPEGMEVDSIGCAIPIVDDSPLVTALTSGEKYCFKNIRFALDKSDIDPSYVDELDDLLDYLRDNPTKKIKIVGHTCSLGSTYHNTELSKRRAAAVNKYLTDRGIDSYRIETSGRGEFEPIATNDTELGRQKNRRIEVEVVEEE